eukprot:g28783.t1
MVSDDLLDVDAGGMVGKDKGEPYHCCSRVERRNGNRDVKKGKGGVKDRPGESEGKVEIGSKIAELFQFWTKEGSSTDDIIDISEKELWCYNHPAPFLKKGLGPKRQLSCSSAAAWPAVFIQLYTLLSQILQH